MESLTTPESNAPRPITRTRPARARNDRRRAAALFIIVTFALGLIAVGPAAPTTQAASLKVCGTVSVYVKATALLNGALTVGSTALIIAAGTTLPSTVQVGANLCFDLTLDLSGRITDATVSANATATVDICGQVSAYAKASATSTGSLTIHGRTFVVAAGTVLPASVTAGADLCLHLTLNGFGQVKGGTAQANVTSTLDVCGQVTAYATATSTTNGHLTIGSVGKTIAAGATLSSSIKLNAYLKPRRPLPPRRPATVVVAAGRPCPAAVVEAELPQRAAAGLLLRAAERPFPAAGRRYPVVDLGKARPLRARPRSPERPRAPVERPVERRSPTSPPKPTARSASTRHRPHPRTAG